MRNRIEVNQSRSKILFSNAQGVGRVPSGYKMLIRRACTAVLQLEDYPGNAEIGVTFTTHSGLAALRRAGRPGTADGYAVMSGDEGMLGRICLSLEDLSRSAAQHDRQINTEVVYAVVKGMLVMLGYTESTPQERAIMENKIDWIMYEFGMPISTKYTVLRYA